MAERSSSRRAALIATAISLPIVVILAFAFTAGRDTGSNDTGAAAPTTQPTGVLPPITQSPQVADPATTATCAQLISALPTTLGDRQPRVARGGGPLVKAWGEPPVVLRCGVSRPADLQPGSSAQVLDIGTGVDKSVEWLPKTDSKGTVWTSIDRAVYIEVSSAGTAAADSLSALSAAIAEVLPAVCQAYPNPPPTEMTPQLQESLCVYRQ